MKLISKRSSFALACAALLTLPGALLADEAEDSINEGLKSYKDGNYASAAKSLQYALSLINERKADSALEALPAEIGSWKGGQGETQSLGMLGGGNVVSRDYTKDDKRAQISITMDSPIVQQMMGILTNPMFAAQAGRPRKVNGQDAMYNKENGEVLMVVENRILVKVEGSSCTEEELLELAKGVNLDNLKDAK